MAEHRLLSGDLVVLNCLQIGSMVKLLVDNGIIGTVRDGALPSMKTLGRLDMG